MRRAVGAICLLAFGAGFLPAGGQSQDSGGSNQQLQDELNALLQELEEGVPENDPFADGRKPDLVVVSTTDVRGEYAPCG